MSKKKILFIGGSLNQTSMVHAVASQIQDDYDCWFTPFFCDAGLLKRLQEAGKLDFSILGGKFRAATDRYFQEHQLPVDFGGQQHDYDLVVTTSDLVIQRTIRRKPIVLIQEGMTDPENFMFHLCKWLGLPRLPGQYVNRRAIRCLSGLLCGFGRLSRVLHPQGGASRKDRGYRHPEFRRRRSLPSQHVPVPWICPCGHLGHTRDVQTGRSQSLHSSSAGYCSRPADHFQAASQREPRSVPQGDLRARAACSGSDRREHRRDDCELRCACHSVLVGGIHRVGAWQGGSFLFRPQPAQTLAPGTEQRHVQPAYRYRMSPPARDRDEHSFRTA